MITIIIVVKNDREIKNTISNLNKISKPGKTEIIVVDASEGKLDDIRQEFKNVRWIYYYNKTKKNKTISEQRNLGIKKANGDIIVFIDANCIPKLNWLIELIKPIREEGENVVWGNVKSIGNNSKHHDVGLNRIYKGKYLSECGAANIAFKKNILASVGIFDEKFEAGEDIDFSWRIIDKGYKIRYEPKAIIYHNWGEWKNEKGRAISYGIARTKLYKKHNKKLKNLLDYHKDLYTTYSIFYFIYITSLIPLTFILPYYPLLILMPFLKNISVNPIRKLYFDYFWGMGVLKELIFGN